MGLEVWMSGAVYVTGTVIGTGGSALLNWQEPLIQTPAWVYQMQG